MKCLAIRIKIRKIKKLPKIYWHTDITEAMIGYKEKSEGFVFQSIIVLPEKRIYGTQLPIFNFIKISSS